MRQLRERRELMRARVNIAGADAADGDSANDDIPEDELSEATVIDGGVDDSDDDVHHAGERDPTVLGEAVDGEAGGVVISDDVADTHARRGEPDPIVFDEAVDGEAGGVATDDPVTDTSGPEVFYIGEESEGHDYAEEDDCWNAVWPEASIAFCTDGLPIPLHSL